MIIKKLEKKKKKKKKNESDGERQTSGKANPRKQVLLMSVLKI